MTLFTERLIALRHSHGISQTEVSKNIKINLRTYQRYEKGEREPRMSELIALADYFNVSIDYLVGRTDNPEKF
ncbi:helix-turn-helix transcriptional regulator [Listeria monocytogenes]|nr:XRE family transcriptional regulator [Listeria monocytogenes]EKZ7015210.1 helix-turn-helix transcriptional regulator [Listeria monocytogenes]